MTHLQYTCLRCHTPARFTITVSTNPFYTIFTFVQICKGVWEGNHQSSPTFKLHGMYVPKNAFGFGTDSMWDTIGFCTVLLPPDGARPLAYSFLCTFFSLYCIVFSLFRLFGCSQVFVVADSLPSSNLRTKFHNEQFSSLWGDLPLRPSVPPSYPSWLWPSHQRCAPLTITSVGVALHVLTSTFHFT